MYVVTHNDQVLLGPVVWNPRYFNSIILDDTELVTSLVQSDEVKIPLDLGSGIKIRACINSYAIMDNPKTQMYNGPFWAFTESAGLASFVVLDKPLSLVQYELKVIAANTRYTKEIKGTTAVVQGLTVTVDTSRGGRDVFVQKYLLMGETDTILWKFPEGWFTLTKSELGACVSAGVAHVQSAFAWEGEIVAQISGATTLAGLDAIVVIEPVVRPMG